MRVAGLILAGGASQRMGAPKALLEWSGQTFLDRLIASLSQSLSPVIVVLGHEAERIRRGLRRGSDALLTLNAEYSLGQLTSLQCGLRAVPDDAAAVVFTPVDHPAIRPSTVARMAGALRESAAVVVIPRFAGRNGHPVGIRRELFPEMLVLGAGGQARDVIHLHREATLYIDVDDSGILDDIDDPDAYSRLISREPAP